MIIEYSEKGLPEEMLMLGIYHLAVSDPSSELEQDQTLALGYFDRAIDTILKKDDDLVWRWREVLTEALEWKAEALFCDNSGSLYSYIRRQMEGLRYLIEAADCGNQDAILRLLYYLNHYSLLRLSKHIRSLDAKDSSFPKWKRAAIFISYCLCPSLIRYKFELSHAIRSRGRFLRGIKFWLLGIDQSLGTIEQESTYEAAVRDIFATPVLLGLMTAGSPNADDQIDLIELTDSGRTLLANWRKWPEHSLMNETFKTCAIEFVSGGWLTDIARDHGLRSNAIVPVTGIAIHCYAGLQKPI